MTVNSYRFSIIIPLEFHRGQALRCIRGWSHEQTYPRDAFQLLIAVPANFPIPELQEIRSLLLPQDRIEQFPHHHDMALIAAMSEFAEGDILVFTESHAFPQSDTLENLNHVIANHPEWPGFSFRSVPLTYNLLSKIEAQMYVNHIEDNLLRHPWLKVLDQCFVIKKQVYRSVGGIEPQYGHFAEWLFAARLFQAGFQIQIDNRPTIYHYYVGKLQDLELFTLDFARGEILFAAEPKNDPCSKMFQEIPELLAYRHWYRKDGYRFLQLKLHLLIQMITEHHQANLASVLMDCLPSFGIALVGVPGSYVFKRCSSWLLKKQLQYYLWTENSAKAQSLFLRWINCLITQERLHYLSAAKVQRQQMTTRSQNTNGIFSWEPDGGYELDLLGFYGLEYHVGTPFRWSAHCAAIHLYLEAGTYQIEISWLAFRAFSDSESHGLSFFLNEQKIDTKSVILQPYKALIRLQVETAQVYRVSWILTPLQFPGDQRLLGLPVHAIKSNKCLLSSARCDQALAAKELAPTYFLHIAKCGGTTLRHFLDNAVHADLVMAPYLEMYYAHELPIARSFNDKPFSVFRGHFGWELPEIVPDKNLKIVTVLREPLERLLSLFSYLKQHQRLAPDLILEEWIDNQIKIPDLMVNYFVPGARNPKVSGYEFTRTTASKILPDALKNLESCLAIGLTEAMDDTLNLLAWHTGLLPCRNLPRNNSTDFRITKQALSENLISKIEKLLESDYVLYARACELFHTQLEQLYSDIFQVTGRKMDSAELRSYLISAYLQRYRQLMQDQQPNEKLSWTIEDSFHGENLHGREQHNGERLRWTGPYTSTHFYFYLGKPRDWMFKLKLHRATPTQHLQTMTCQVNSTPLQLERSVLVDGHYLITALIPKSVSALSDEGVATFEISTELIRGKSEFRMLGIAIMGFVLHPV